ncbi:MAG: 6-carboxytetrahydropterin synthase QueD [Planctomycetota bacterium]|nr:6-carboxytetrahydropterin synthase QueD [Planctomycetota bacterium]
MEAELIKTFRFEAAHTLPNAPDGHKCRRMHGHSYRVDIHVTGRTDPATGWVIDFGQIKQIVGAELDKLDHRCLNDIPGLENSTSELLAKYLWDRIQPGLPGLSAITVWESDTSRCVYKGN